MKGIIIDNTNPSSIQRKEWFDKVPDTWKKMVIYIDIPKKISIHMMKYRMFYGGAKLSLIPIHCYYKRLDVPINNDDVNVIKINSVIIPIKHEFNHKLRFI